MTYDKETKQELMEDELKEDKIKEHSNEINDGAFETWKEENKDDLTNNYIKDNEGFKEYCNVLISQFIDDNENDFNDYCKERWNEENE